MQFVRAFARVLDRRGSYAGYGRAARSWRVGLVHALAHVGARELSRLFRTLHGVLD